MSKSSSSAVIVAFGFLLALALSAASGGGDAPAKSPLDRFSAEERAKLTAGEAIYRHVEKKGEDGQTSGHAESVALIKAPVDRCFSIFTEFDKQELYFPRKTKSEVLKQEGNRFWVQKEFWFYVISVEYVVIYTKDEKAHRVDFEMDKAYPHDLEDTAGYFQFEAVDANTSLFTYAATRVETGLKVPNFIREYITSRDLPAVVINVKKRIESGGTWVKED